MEAPQDFAGGRELVGRASLHDAVDFPLVSHLDLDHCSSFAYAGRDGAARPGATPDPPTMHYTLRSCEAESLEDAIEQVHQRQQDGKRTPTPINPSIKAFLEEPKKKLVIGILLPADGRALADTLESLLNELDFSSAMRTRMNLDGVLICVVADSVDSESGGNRLEPRAGLRKELSELGLWSDAIVRRSAGFASRATRRPSRRQSMPAPVVRPRHSVATSAPGPDPARDPRARACTQWAFAQGGAEVGQPGSSLGSSSNVSQGTLQRMHRRAKHQNALLRDQAAEMHDTRHLLWFAHRPNCYTRLRGRREFHYPVDLCCIVERHPLDLHSASFWVRKFMAEQVDAESVLLLQGGTTLLYQSLSAMLLAGAVPGVGAVTPATQVRVPNACDGFNPAFAAYIFHQRASDLLYRIPASVFGYCPTLPERCYLLNMHHVASAMPARCDSLDHPPPRRMAALNPLRPLTLLRGFSAVSGTRCLANAIALRCGLRVVHVPAARCSVPGHTTVTSVALYGKVRVGAVVWGVADAVLSLRALWGSDRNPFAKLAVTAQVLAAWVELLALAVAPGLAYVAVRACVADSLALSLVSSLKWSGEIIKFAFVVLLIAQVSLAMRTSPATVASLHMLSFAFLGFMTLSTLLYVVVFSASRVDELPVRAAAGTLALLQLDSMLHEHVTTLLATAPQALFMSLSTLVGGAAHSVFAGGVDEPPSTTRAYVPPGDVGLPEPTTEPDSGRDGQDDEEQDSDPFTSPGSSSFARASGALARRSNNLAVIWFALNIGTVTALSSSVLHPKDTLRLLLLLTAVLLLPRLAVTFLSGLKLRLTRCFR